MFRTKGNIFVVHAPPKRFVRVYLVSSKAMNCYRPTLRSLSHGSCFLAYLPQNIGTTNPSLAAALGASQVRFFCTLYATAQPFLGAGTFTHPAAWGLRSPLYVGRSASSKNDDRVTNFTRSDTSGRSPRPMSLLYDQCTVVARGKSTMRTAKSQRA